MMNAIERQEFRLEILKKLCEILDFDLNKTLERNGAIFKLFPDCNEEELLNHISYLKEKGYITYTSIALHGFSLPIMIKVTTRAIDLIEKIETKMSTEKFEQDFSKLALNNFSNIINSQIIVSSPGANINISNNDENEIEKYLDDLIKNNPQNKILKNIINNTKNEIKNKTATKDFLRGIGSTLMSFGVSLASNLLTPTVQAILGIIP
jgi:hypothetical protein